ncbi:hypothetical protein GPECTOR_27g701 [Gonium pectorale]|uniref:Glycosyltransferase family 92 protein n=1 Tax=Gonium pectorale TaxID=33097 RepID=A0A150GGN9_GONPE|nr:hypothetical protein GPECTOR_27g701 [Gonium pectorale]|eukprot:KXZ48530.1 hypothetical protein GPECTOR_27g701 [Gonium pectorale]
MIYLLDHNSTIPMFYEIADYVAEGKVQYTAFRSESPRRPYIRRFSQGLQGRAFQQCFDWGRDSFQWMAFTDLDEMLVLTDPKYNSSLPALLRNYEEHGAVLAHWVRLGSSGVEERQPGQGLLETFTKCTPVRDHVKGIANLRYASLGINAHTFFYHGGRRGIRPGDNRRVGVAHALRK